MADIFKRIVFWTYGRSAWQYDVLCALILSFIFLTPKTRFTSELPSPTGHQNVPAANTLLLTWPARESAVPPDTQEIERRARQLAGREGVRVREVRPVRDEAGTVIAYQVDIE
jgi:membrane protein implicated in regulation of membrane protease activity